MPVLSESEFMTPARQILDDKGFLGADEPAERPKPPGGATMAPDPATAFPRESVGQGEFQFPTPAEQIGAEQGISLDQPVPAEVRLKAGFGMGTPEEIYTRLLTGYFGPGTEVRTEPETGKLIYRRPGEGRFNFVHDARTPIDFGDLASTVGDLLPTLIGAGVGVGGAAGGAMAGPAGAITLGAIGEGIGTGTGEYLRLKAGQRMGAVPADLDDVALLRAALPEATVAALGALAVPTAFALYRRLGPGKMAPPISSEQFEIMWGRAEEKLRAAGMKTGPTTAQAMQGTTAGDVMLSAQEELIRRPGTAPGRAVAEFTDEQMAELGRQGIDSKPPIASAELGDRLTQTGSTVRGMARADIAGVVLPDKAITDLARQNARQSYDDALTGPVRRPVEAGAPVRQGLRVASDRFDEAADALYAPIRAEAAAVTGLPERTFAVAQRYDALTGRDIIPGLTQEDSDLVRGMLTRMVNQDQNLQPIGYEQIDRALHSLRRAVRQESTGLPAGRDVQMLRELQGALAADREQMLLDTGRGDLAQRLAGADLWYKGEKALFDSTVIRDLLSVEEGRATRARVLDSAVFSRIMESPENATIVAEILARPGLTIERETMRGAIRQKWREAVDPDNLGKADPAKHKEFMDLYRDQMRPFFNPAEMKRFESPGAMFRALKAREEALSEITEQMGKTPIGQIGSIENASEVFRRTWQEGTPEPSLIVANLMTRYVQRTGDTAPLEGYRALVKDDLTRAVVQQAGGRAYIDPAALDKYLTAHGPGLRSVMGEEYLSGLLRIKDAAEVVNAQGRVAVQDRTAPPLYHVMRAVAGLDVAANRSITAVQRRIKEGAAERLKNMLLDPDEMRRVLRARNMTSGDFARWAVGGAEAADYAHGN